MADIPVPFTGQSIDTDEPMDAGLTVLLLIAGFSVFFFAQDLGGSAKSFASQMIGLGSDAANEVDVV